MLTTLLVPVSSPVMARSARAKYDFGCSKRAGARKPVPHRDAPSIVAHARLEVPILVLFWTKHLLEEATLTGGAEEDNARAVGWVRARTAWKVQRPTRNARLSSRATGGFVQRAPFGDT